MGRLTDFYERHSSLFGITGWLIAVLAIILTIYLYVIGRQVGEISYLVTTTKIFDSTIPSSDIVVSQRDGNPIRDDIFAATITVWNSGDLRADEGGSKPDIPITVSLDGPGRIIDTILQQYNFAEITNYDLITADDAKSVQVLWKNFRPGFGVRFTALFTGTEETSLSVMGDIFRISIVERKASTRKTSSVKVFDYSVPAVLIAALALPALVIFIILLLEGLHRILKKFQLAWVLDKLGFLFPVIAIGLFIFILVSYIWKFFNEANPPI